MVDVEFSQSMKKRALNPNVGAWVGIGAGIGALSGNININKTVTTATRLAISNAFD